MQSSLAHKLASFSTATKLVAGFSLVLLLTALVAAAGLLALRDINQGVERLQRMQGLSEHVLRMRSLERAYAVGSNKSYAQHLHETAEAIVLEVQSLNGLLDAQTVAAVNQLEPAVTEYRQRFSQFEALSDTMQMALEGADWLVASAANSLELLREGLSEDGVMQLQDSQGAEGHLWVEQAVQVGHIDKLLQQAMEQARENMESSRRSGNAQDQVPQAKEAQSLAQKLREQISDPGYASILSEVVLNVDSFNERMSEYANALQAQNRLYAELNAQADVMLAKVEQALMLERDSISAEQRRSSRLIIAVAALALLLGLGAAVLISVMIVRPLKQVIVLAQQVADGDLSAEIQVSRTDEVGQLQQAMLSMSHNLRAMVGQLQGGVEQISSSAQALSSVTEQTRQGVSSQKLETDQVATAMSEMAATVQEVARNAEVAADSARAADERAKGGSQEVLNSQQCADQLVQAIAASTQSIEQLSCEAQKIDAVLEVIKGVADQTNLLALNAAIEAARAGEMGRGFAVVADEVRALARRTQDSTAEIERLIATLRGGSERAVSDMQRSAQLVAVTVKSTQQTGSSLNGIAQAVSQIYEMNQQIAAAAEQQSVVAEQINRSVTSIRDIADQSAQAMEHTTASSVQLARLGSDLQGVAAQFRL